MLLSNIYIVCMSNSHRAFFTQLCLIALLLWGQAAVAQHELNHSWHDATELCQVFSSADNAKAAFVVTQATVAEYADGNNTVNIRLSLLESTVTEQTARGPPTPATI